MGIYRQVRTVEGSENTTKPRSLARFHFIVGLPRSGCSLLAAILDQNPGFVARVSSPAESVFCRTLGLFDDSSEQSLRFDDQQRIALLRGAIDAIYHDRPLGAAVFDANPAWLDHVDELARLFPLCRFILCVRNPAQIINAIEVSGPLTSDQEALSKSVNRLIASDGAVGAEVARLREALSSSHTERMLVLDYDRLADDPEEAIEVLYDFLREPAFGHDFSDIGRGYGAQIGFSGPVRRSDHAMVLPMRTVLQLSGKAFWRNLKRTSATMMLGRAR